MLHNKHKGYVTPLAARVISASASRRHRLQSSINKPADKDPWPRLKSKFPTILELSGHLILFPQQAYRFIPIRGLSGHPRGLYTNTTRTPGSVSTLQSYQANPLAGLARCTNRSISGSHLKSLHISYQE